MKLTGHLKQLLKSSVKPGMNDQPVLKNYLDRVSRVLNFKIEYKLELVWLHDQILKNLIRINSRNKFPADKYSLLGLIEQDYQSFARQIVEKCFQVQESEVIMDLLHLFILYQDELMCEIGHNLYANRAFETHGESYWRGRMIMLKARIMDNGVSFLVIESLSSIAQIESKDQSAQKQWKENALFLKG